MMNCKLREPGCGITQPIIQRHAEYGRLVGHFCADLGHRSEKRGRDDPILEALHLRGRETPFSIFSRPFGLDGETGIKREAIISFSGAKLSNNNLVAMEGGIPFLSFSHIQHERASSSHLQNGCRLLSPKITSSMKRAASQNVKILMFGSYLEPR